MTKLLNEEIVRQIEEVFGGLKEPVHMLFFGSQSGCDYCDETHQLAEEVSAISDKVSLSVYDLEADKDVASKYNIVGAPYLIIAGQNGGQVLDFGVRFAGIPSGHEFSSFIQAILIVSSRDSGLNPQTRTILKELQKPVHLQVFVTPT